MNIKIGTLNCQNNIDNRLNRNNHALLLVEHIKKEQYDILGLQELTIPFINKVKKYLNKNKLYGAYQYGNRLIGTKFPIIKTYNQANKILTSYQVLKTKTYALPWIPHTLKNIIKMLKKKCLTRRIMTYIKININNKNIYIINTHLDYYIKELQQRQLNYILKVINKLKDDSQIILLGDFNLHTNDTIFINFITELSKLGLKRVPVNIKTNGNKYNDKTSIDHIFIPSIWQISDCGIISDEKLDIITDHKAVYVNVCI